MTVLARFNDDRNAPFCFDHNGTCIVNPLVSECGRFAVSPEYYGFEEYETGGGCTAWMREFVLPDGRAVQMLMGDESGCTHEIDTPHDLSTWGISVVDEDCCSANYSLRDDENAPCGYSLANHSVDGLNA